MTIKPVRMEDAASTFPAVTSCRFRAARIRRRCRSICPNIPELEFEFVFCDTGAELPETYEYLDRLEALLGHKIIRISALEMLDIPQAGPVGIRRRSLRALQRISSEPAIALVHAHAKIHPYEKYIGSAPAYSYIAIRADENRQGYIGSGGKPVLLSEQPNILPVYPFKDEGLGLADMQRLLDDSGLGLPKYYEWRSRSGCYFCFYQQIARVAGAEGAPSRLFERRRPTKPERTRLHLGGRALAGRRRKTCRVGPSRRSRTTPAARSAICEAGMMSE